MIESAHGSSLWLGVGWGFIAFGVLLLGGAGIGSRRGTVRPILTFEEPRFDPPQQLHNADGSSLGSGQVLRTTIRNANDAGIAERAHVRLRFLEVGSHNWTDGREFRLRWCDEPMEPVIDLDPNNYPYDIDVGVVFSDRSGFFYVWSTDSQFDDVRRGDGRYRIDEDEFLVEVAVYGKGFEERQVRQVWPLSGSPQVFEEGHAPGT